MKYNVNNYNFEKVLEKIRDFLEDSNYEINELLKIDYKYCKIRVDLEILKQLIEEMKKEKIKEFNEQKIKIRYNGNPYITLNISILAILTKTIIYFDCSQNMLGINRFIIRIVNSILEDFNTDKLIYLENFDDKEREDFDKIICIDDINKYNKYLLENNTKAKFYAFDYLDLYYDSNEFDELIELIYNYGDENQIPIESYSEFDIDEAVEMIKEGYGNAVVVLTNSDMTKKIFRDSINNKILFINKNPHTRKKVILREILL